MDKEQSQRKRKRAGEESTQGASSSSSICPEATGVGSGQYDVFLSFRGSDTCKTFTDHLYHSLVKGGIVSFCVFRDENSIPIGEEFGSKILDAITQSKISIPIICEKYASSKWCLRELVCIMECKKSLSHIVLPIFYKVARSDVRHLKGNFGDAFHLSREHFDEKDIQEWQRALNEVSNLNGWESQKIANGHEGKLIEHVVETVISKLLEDFQLDVPMQLLGLDDHMKKIMNWIDNPSDSARMIGIYGMGGIGKTTLAKCIYDKLSNKFLHVSFLPDVRETTRRHGIMYLQHRLIYDILRSTSEVSRVGDGINIIKSIFKRKKVLILLDDIGDKNQLDALAKKRSWFGAGSMIIVTTRNKAILNQSEFKVDWKYELNELGEVHALVLFNKHAFCMDHSPREFEGISCDIISTMGGLPLALKVVGSYLYRKTMKVWEDVKEQLKNQPHRDVQNILRISYDALQDGDKQIFLDIVCSFIDEKIKYIMYFWEDHGFYPNQGIEELKLRCLIKIRDDGGFMVHDQLRDLGRSIFCQGQLLEKCSGPWDDDYEGVPRVLRLPGSRPSWFYDILRASSSGTSDEVLHKLCEVRWIQWTVMESDLFLSTINLRLLNLSVLELPWSFITEDWEGWSSFKASKRLQVLNLSCCPDLRRTPDLSAFAQLKILVLSDCPRLEHLHLSIGKLTSLVSLDLNGCRSIKELPEEMGELKNLEELLLEGVGVTEIPTSIASLRKLHKLSARGCELLREIPSSIGDLQNLHHLDLRDSAIEKLPSAIGRLKNVWSLRLSWCRNLKGAIPSEIGDLPSLVILDLSGTPISDLPESVRNLYSLQRLNLLCCDKLRSLPELPSSLQHLDLKGCYKLRSLPKLPYSLPHLDLRGCCKLPSLPELPSFLQHLDLRGCCKLRSLSELPFSLQHLDLRGCCKLQSLPDLPSSLQHLDLRGCYKLRSLLPSGLTYPVEPPIAITPSSGYPMQSYSMQLLSNDFTPELMRLCKGRLQLHFMKLREIPQTPRVGDMGKNELC